MNEIQQLYFSKIWLCSLKRFQLLVMIIHKKV